jgi:hypothetical protein
MSASTSSGTPVSGELVTWTFMYVNNIHSFVLLSSIVLSFIQLIYIHIDLLLKDDGLARKAPTNPAHTSNSRGAGGLMREVIDEKGEHYVEDEECYI